MVSAIAIEEGFKDFVNGKSPFEEFAIRLFQFQANQNNIYREYLKLIGCNLDTVKALDQIPFLPISFFKNHQIVSASFDAQVVFSSSSTTGQIPSKHYIKSSKHYLQNAKQIFEEEIGTIDNTVVIGLLPSYLERSDSSLVFMVDYFIKESKLELSGFHLSDYRALVSVLQSAKDAGLSVVLFAVRYALLDFAEQFELNLNHITIIETGGMKGKRGPVSNEDLKSIVSEKLNPKSLVSEYGMTELQSQAYSDESFTFKMPDTLRVFISDLNDPFSYVEEGRSGRINVIDLANLFSCAFIATDDMGRKVSEDKFKVLGRIDHSEQRGCNLLVADVIT